MDGLVTKALDNVIRARLADAEYREVLRAAGVEGKTFVAGEVYPDELTSTLVSAAARALATTPAGILEMVGEHWVEFAIREGYGRFLTTAGRTFRDVLMNLDRMHEKISLIYPHLQQPTFWTTEVADDSLVLHYMSARHGLAPLVIGIVRGLAKMHHVRVGIDHRARRAEGAQHDEFVIRVFG
jgi:heme-NO-binding protein